MERLHIYLFGGFLLERGGVALPPIASRSGRSLFAHLVMHPDRPLQRDLLAGIFWPDLPDGRARRRLSHTLWQIQDVVSTETVSYLEGRRAAGAVTLVDDGDGAPGRQVRRRGLDLRAVEDVDVEDAQIPALGDDAAP